jgi:hypothetical protein
VLQGWVLQEVISKEVPAQAVPPFAGAGLLQSRDLD